ncbi:hypothetical protein ACMFMF_001238 [Clarireedia jacksonii]
MDDKTFTSILQPSPSFDRRPSSIATKPFTHSSTPTSTQSTSSIKSILSTPNRSTIMDRKNHFDLTNSLMSPPEALPLDNLQRTSPGLTMESKMRKMPSMVKTRSGSLEEPTISQIITDPILYPLSDNQGTSATQPSLFDNDDSLVTQRVVNGHVAAREASMFREFSPPRQDEYELALEFKSQVAKTFNKNPRLWFRREMAYLMEDRELQSGGRRYTNIAPATTGPRVVRPIGQNSGRVVKTTPRPPRQSAPSRPPRAAGTPGPDVKRVAREDKDFETLPDYCPPITSLPNKPNSLKVDWKGAPIDLRQDPNVHLLHPDEVSLAANLRLDCATYLTSKRRIFIKRIEALRIGKEFRKTDAQQACKIDVNKASKLWQAFDKVGWLNPTWVKKYA